MWWNHEFPQTKSCSSDLQPRKCSPSSTKAVMSVASFVPLLPFSFINSVCRYRAEMDAILARWRRLGSTLTNNAERIQELMAKLLQFQVRRRPRPQPDLHRVWPDVLKRVCFSRTM